MIKYGEIDAIRNLSVFDRVICRKVSEENCEFFEIGGNYAVVRFKNDFHNVQILDDDGNTRWLEEGDEFVPEVKKKAKKFKQGDRVTCVDISGQNVLKLGELYSISNVYENSVKVLGSDIRWKLNRFERNVIKVGDKVLCINTLGLSGKVAWWPLKDKEYVVVSTNTGNIGVELPLAKEVGGNAAKHADGTNPVWPIDNFRKINAPVAVKKVKEKVKLDAAKMHTHNCVKCEKQIFPKTMCKCGVSVEIPL